MSPTPRAVADAAREVERRLDAMSLADLARLLGRDDLGFFACPYCQALPRDRIMHGPAARLLSSSGLPALASEATTWLCLRCALGGTRASLIRLLVENPDVLEGIAREFAAAQERVS